MQGEDRGNKLLTNSHQTASSYTNSHLQTIKIWMLINLLRIHLNLHKTQQLFGYTCLIQRSSCLHAGLIDSCWGTFSPPYGYGSVYVESSAYVKCFHAKVTSA